MPWDRRSNESTPAYEAAQQYFTLGAERSTAAVARVLSKSKTLMDRWSGQHEWVVRASAYDTSLMEAARKAAAAEVVQMRKNHLALSRSMQGKVAEALRVQDARRMTPAAVARWVEVATRLEREARGLAGEVVEVRGEVADVDLARRIAVDPGARELALGLLDRLAAGPVDSVDLVVPANVGAPVVLDSRVRPGEPGLPSE